MRRAILLLFGLILIVLAATPTAHAGKRVALVIGIDTYDNLPALRKAVNDHKSVAEALTGLGFEVVSGENLTRREMNAKLAELDAKIAPGDTVFFYFAGHGVALGAENYLLPRDLPKPNEGEENLVRDEGYPVDAVVRRVQGRGAAVSFFVLDACRDNPIAAAGVRSIGGTRGLTRVDAPKGVFVLFSAGMGQTALDRLGDNDPDPNSVFTRKLVPLMKTPGLTHLALAKRVQQQVDELAATVRHPQQPAYYDQIIGEVEFNPSGPTTSSGTRPTAVAVVTPPAPVTLPKAIEPAVVTVPKPGVATGYKPGDTFKDCDICPEMVVVPGGSFMMGLTEPVPSGFTRPNEAPRHGVKIAGSFAVGKLKVTKAQYEAFAADTNYEAKSCKPPKPGPMTWSVKPPPIFKKNVNEPAVCVSWDDTAIYLRWLASTTGKSYRLLTETEWEYAAQHSDEFGLKEMLVPNAYEWVEDCYTSNYSRAPDDGSPAIGDCALRMIRGGQHVLSWGSDKITLTSAEAIGARNSSQPSVRYPWTTFRVARTLSP